MVRAIRKLVAVSAIALAGEVLAVGLGEIETRSSLNAKFDAEIEVLDSRDLQPTEVIVSLASAEDFNRVGVERFFFLTDLKFRVDTRSGQNLVITVSSGQPVTEPYLNFLIEVMWPQGRLLKEYTVLLDPPTFTEASVAPLRSPTRTEASSSGAGTVARPTTATTGTRVNMPAQAPARPAPTPEERMAGDTYTMTDRDDTLWKIAQRTDVAGDTTINQRMLAIVRLNPKAFIGDNINLLKAGYRLQLPDESEAGALPESAAIEQVAMHNEAWRNYRQGGSLALPGTMVADQRGSATEAEPVARGQLDATAASDPEPTVATNRPEGELRIVAGDGDGVADGVGGDGEAQAALQEALTSAEEERDRAGRQADELQFRLDRAASDVDEKQREIEVRDQRIAALEEQLRNQREAQSQQQSPTPEPDLMATLTSPLVLGVGVGVLLLVLVLVWLASRRRSSIEDEAVFYDEDDIEPDRVEPAVDEDYEVTEAEMDLDEDEEPAEEDFAAAFAADADDETVEATEASDIDDEFGDTETVVAAVPDNDDDTAEGGQIGDVIGEADIYIAYGRYPQAISLLEAAIGEDEERNDVRFKLLELYVETRDEERFEHHLGVLADNCDDEEMLLGAREMQSRFNEPLTGASNDAGTDGDTEIGLVDSTLEDAGDAGGEDEFELDLEVESAADELTLDVDDSATVADGQVMVDGFSEDADSEPEPEIELEEAEASVSNGEFELELDPLDEEETSDKGSDLGGDLGMDFDPERDVEATDGLESVDEPDADSTTDAVAEDLAVDEITADEQTADDELIVDDDVDEIIAEIEQAETSETDIELSVDDEIEVVDELDGLGEADDVIGDLSLDEELDDDSEQIADDDFDFDTGDTAATKLDLARAYIDMGDNDGAKDILGEVVTEGNEEQQTLARSLLEEIG